MQNRRMNQMAEMFFVDNKGYVGDKRVHFASVSYAEDITINFDFFHAAKHRRDKKANVRTSLEDRAYANNTLRSNVSDVGAALEFVLDRAFTREFGARDDAMKVVLMLTHRYPNVNLTNARFQVQRLNHQTDIKLHLVHFTEYDGKGNEHNTDLLPYRNVVVLRNPLVDDSLAYFQYICRPCTEPEWFPVPQVTLFYH